MFERKRAPTAFTGEGARLFGGRWTSPGVPAVYTATSFALALLEIMANARRGRIPLGMVYCTVDVPESIRVEILDESALPKRWYRSPAPPELQAIGNAWTKRGQSVGLVVPSAVARIERNVILNPLHADFATLPIGMLENIPVDERLRESP